MGRIFVSLFRYFKKQPVVFWVLLISTFVLFTFFATKLRYEEDILKLLPQSDKAEESGLAFGQLSVKDKIFVQFTAKDGADSVDTEMLAQACDDFVDILVTKDTASHFIDNILYKVQPEWTVNGLDFALSNFPAYLEESAYKDFDSLLTRPALLDRMAQNLDTVVNDYEGNLTMMVSCDPAGLRYSMLNQLGGAADGINLSEGVSFGSYTFMNEHLFTPDGTVALAFVAPTINSFDSEEASKVEKLIEAATAEFYESHEGVDVLYHGATERSAGNSRRIKKDLVLTIAVSLALIILVLGFCFRNARTMIKMLFPIIYGLVFAMSCMYWIKGIMSLMAMGIGAIVLGIAVSYVLHVLMHFKYVGDPERVINDQATPVCMSCLTTIGAFVGLLFTQSALLKDFGIFACFMLVGTTFAALAFLPQFFDVNRNKKNEKAFALIQKVNSYPLDRNIPLAVAIAAIVLVGFIFAGKVGFDSDLQNINYFSKILARSEALYGEKVNKGYSSVFYAAKGDTFDEALQHNKAVLATMDSLQQAGVVKQYSAVTKMFLTDAEQQVNIDRWKAYWTPERIASARKDISWAAGQVGLDPEMFDMFFTIVEADYEPASLLDSGALPVELSSNFAEQVGDEYLVFTSALLDRADKRAVGDAVSACEDGLVVDPFYYASDMIQIVHDDYSKVLYISSIFVLIVLLITFKEVLVSLVAFLPMFLSWFVVEGLMAIFGIEFNILNIVISSFIFGVGVDYSIFIMDGLLEEAKGGDGRLLVYHKSAILLSALFLVIVVASLLLAKSPAIHSVGVITLIGMASTILIAYCLMPLIFRMLLKNNTLRGLMLRMK